MRGKGWPRKRARQDVKNEFRFSKMAGVAAKGAKTGRLKDKRGGLQEKKTEDCGMRRKVCGMLLKKGCCGTECVAQGGRRLLNEFEMRGFMAQKRSVESRKRRMLQDRGALLEEEGGQKSQGRTKQIRQRGKDS